MTLDAVHLAAIEGLVDSIDRPGRANRRERLAERLWGELIAEPSPDIPLDPLDPPARYAGPVDELAVKARPFERVSAVDAGSLNPTTFQNGLVVDLAHAAMATTPSDVDRHRHRTLVAVIHGPPDEVRSDREWGTFDEGYGRAKLLAAPAIDREEETAVHTLALEGAEMEHAFDNRDGFGDLLVLDGSVYPASVLHWEDREGALRASIAESVPKAVLARGVDVVDACLADDVSVIGFVKNWTARGLVRAIESGDSVDVARLPWRTDYGLFQQWLDALDVEAEPALRWTSWFRMDYGVGTAMPGAVERLDLGADGPPDRYRLAFMVVYDPRENVAFRVEAPTPIVADPDRRSRVTDHVLSAVAQTAGPPPTLAKADALAGISRHERRELRHHLERLLGSRQLRRYDAVRWPGGRGDHAAAGPMGNR